MRRRAVRRARIIKPMASTTPGARPHLVAKIGGSLHAAPQLAQWIAALKHWPHRLTIVCGGGPFADAVRAAQPKMAYSDATAHTMALLAMEQYALALASLYDLDLFATVEEAAAIHARGRVALWRPSRMIADAPDVAPCWDATSDSLAAWLAGKSDADALLVIKSLDIHAGATLPTIAADGVVDAAFATYVADTPLFIAGPQALEQAGRHLAAGDTPGQSVITTKQKIAS